MVQNTNLNINFVDIRQLTFQRGNHTILSNINMKFPKGKIVAIMGPSGIGKTTLLQLIGGQLLPDSGEILVDGNNISKLSRRYLYEIRKNMSILFQSNALFTDINVFENIAFPLRRHTNLPEPVLRSIVLMKLETVGLRGIADLMPTDLSGGMARRVALARAMALDPELIMLDEPFVGQDPIAVGILVKLINKFNRALKITCIIVSHDVPEILGIADYVYVLGNQHIIAEGTPSELHKNQDPWVRQFLDGIVDGPVSFNFPAEDYQTQLLKIRS